MGKSSMHLVVIFIVIYCGEMTSGEFINLKYFREAIAFSERDLATCGIGCERLEFNKETRRTSTYAGQACDGYLDNCQTIVARNNTSVQYCLDDENSRMAWVENKIYGGAHYGIQSRECVTPQNEELSVDRGTKCEVCMCTCYHERESSKTIDVWKFSLLAQTSEDTKVVTGVRFREIGKVIYLQIKENDLVSTTNGTWKPIDEDSELAAKDFAIVAHNLQTINLDQIFTPENSVITGVKFVKVPNPNSTDFALELRIRSTKLNAENDALDPEHEDWHSGDPSTLTTGPRWWPDRGIRNVPISRVSFNRTSLHKDLGMTANPQLYEKAVESCGQHDFPLKGIQLLLVELGGHEVIIPRISPAIIKGLAPPDFFDYEDETDDEGVSDSAHTANSLLFLIIMLPSLIICCSFN